MLDLWDGELESLLKLFDRANPLREKSHGTELMEVSVEADAPGWLIITQLADPQWRGRWLEGDGQGEMPAEILPTFRRNDREGAWQRVWVPGPGHRKLRLEYVATDVTLGLAISGASWLVWCVIIAVVAARERREEWA
jgi:hypothetical protein